MIGRGRESEGAGCPLHAVPRPSSRGRQGSAHSTMQCGTGRLSGWASPDVFKMFCKLPKTERKNQGLQLYPGIWICTVQHSYSLTAYICQTLSMPWTTGLEWQRVTPQTGSLKGTSAHGL